MLDHEAFSGSLAYQIEILLERVQFFELSDRDCNNHKDDLYIEIVALATRFVAVAFTSLSRTVAAEVASDCVAVFRAQFHLRHIAAGKYNVAPQDFIPRLEQLARLQTEPLSIDSTGGDGSTVSELFGSHVTLSIYQDAMIELFEEVARSDDFKIVGEYVDLYETRGSVRPTYDLVANTIGIPTILAHDVYLALAEFHDRLSRLAGR